MNREEEILKASYEVADIKSDDYYTQIDYYIKGAEWADENPKEGLVNIDKVCKILWDIYSETGTEYADMFIQVIRKKLNE